MLKTLLKSRFEAFFASFSGANSQKKKKKKKQQSLVSRILLMLLFVVLVGYIMVALGAVIYIMSQMALITGQTWAVQALAAMIASLLCVIGSVLTAKTQIFESKDNELLLAMPIPPKYIFLSRIIMLLIVNYALEAIVMIPTIVVYAVVVGYSPLGALFTLIVCLLLPLFSLSVTIFVAWLISAIASRVKNKTMVSVVFTFLFMAVYFIGCGAFGGFVGASEGSQTVLDLSGLKNTLIFYWMGEAMANASALNLLFSALASVIPAIIVYWTLDRSFIKIITTKTGTKKIKYVAKEARVSTPDGALLRKEMNRFFTSSAYILNSGMGNIMTIIIAIFVVIAGMNITPLLEISPVFENIVPTVASMLIIFMASMNMVSAPSISLEDKSLWILQSAPIEPKRVLRAKTLSHIVICTPCTLISSLIVSIAFKVGVLNAIISLLASFSMVVFTACFGMLLGVKFPKFNWQNETVAVKQGFAVFGSMLGSMLLSMLFGAGGIALALAGVGFWLIGLILITLTTTMSIIIAVYLSRGGAAVLENLRH